MKLYDADIRRLLSLASGAQFLPLEPGWPDAGKNQLIFRNDMACELGGGTLSALGGTLLTSEAELVPRDGVLLLGQDLPGLRQDTPYARVSLVRVNPQAMGDGELLYRNIRKIEYVRYRLNPKGFMPRISASSRRESVRVSRQALAEGLNFARVGQLFRDGFHGIPAVEAVTTLFITDPRFPFGELEALLLHTENITKALDHLLQNVKMDCHSCSLQEICAEVEQLRRSDFEKEA